MSIGIKQLPSSQRPRERMLTAGPGALSDVELVALLLGGDLGCAGEVVARLGGAAGIRRAVLGELCEIPGVGVARACQIRAAVELGFRAAGAAPDPEAQVHTPAAAHATLRELSRLEQEELHVLGLDARHRAACRFAAARGALNVVHVAPRDVYRRLLREGAAAAIVAHNHPTGDVAPSEEDVLLTRRLRAAGELVGLPLVDHLIIGADAYYSFSENRIVRVASG
jgi:DNA repair protein RadC